MNRTVGRRDVRQKLNDGWNLAQNEQTQMREFDDVRRFIASVGAVFILSKSASVPRKLRESERLKKTSKSR